MRLIHSRVNLSLLFVTISFSDNRNSRAVQVHEEVGGEGQRRGEGERWCSKNEPNDGLEQLTANLLVPVVRLVESVRMDLLRDVFVPNGR